MPSPILPRSTLIAPSPSNSTGTITPHVCICVYVCIRASFTQTLGKGLKVFHLPSVVYTLRWPRAALYGTCLEWPPTPGLSKLIYGRLNPGQNHCTVCERVIRGGGGLGDQIANCISKSRKQHYEKFVYFRSDLLLLLLFELCAMCLSSGVTEFGLIYPYFWTEIKIEGW